MSESYLLMMKNEEIRHKEKEAIDKLVGDFSYKSSRGQALINRLLQGYEPTIRYLVSVADVISEISGVPLQRKFKRRHAALVLWFDKNYDDILPYIDKISLKFGKREDLKETNLQSIFIGNQHNA